MKVLKRIFTITIVILVFTTNMNALQDDSDPFYIPDDPESSEDTPNEDFDTGSDSIPLDGGLSILLAGAAVFGIRKLHKK